MKNKNKTKRDKIRNENNNYKYNRLTWACVEYETIDLQKKFRRLSAKKNKKEDEEQC